MTNKLLTYLLTCLLTYCSRRCHHRRPCWCGCFRFRRDNHRRLFPARHDVTVHDVTEDRVYVGNTWHAASSSGDRLVFEGAKSRFFRLWQRPHRTFSHQQTVFLLMREPLC